MGMGFTKILLYQRQIDQLNWHNLQRPATGLCALADAPDAILAADLEALMHLDGLPQEPRYDQNGTLYMADTYAALQARAALPPKAGLLPVRHAVAVDNSPLRRFPTMAGSYRADEVGELDRFAVSLIKLGEPVLVYWQDDSGLWSFVRSAQAYGWMRTAHFAWEDDDYRWRQYCTDSQRLLVADSRRMLDYVDGAGMAQRQLLLMGTRLPLYDASPRNFVFGLPIQDQYGNLAMLQLMMPRDGGVLPGLMPLSAQNIVSQAEKMLGESYGWGGTGCYRDCTSLVADVFAVFGLQLPRNSGQQLAMQGVVRCAGDVPSKYRQIAALSPGSVLYFPGHAMLYLGQRDDQLEILHSVYAIGLPAGDRLIPHKLRRVVLGELRQLRTTGQSFLEAITAYWSPAEQTAWL